MKKQSVSRKIASSDNSEIHLFAAANTTDGFVSFFDKSFCRDGINKIYILKGGPGSGKSTLMKNYAENAEKQGYTPIYYHCSSDPHSLDGVTVKETGISIVDGTSPHVFEPSYPGVRDIYVDLSSAWNTDLLENSKESIIKLANAKSQCYKTAYRLLQAYGNVTDEMYECSKHFVDISKIKNFTMRFAKKHMKNKNSRINEPEKIIVNAISSKGPTRFFTLENAANTVFFVKDTGIVSKFVFEELAKETKKSGADAVFALSPENPYEICGIYLKDTRICISIYDENMIQTFEHQGKNVKIINTARFIDPEKYKAHRQKFRFSAKCRETLFGAALSELSAAGKFHEKLESIYISATDYKTVEEISNHLISGQFTR